MGSFTSQDSYRGEYNNPLTQNLYTYCAGDPVNRVDPTGHSWLSKWLKNRYKKATKNEKKRETNRANRSKAKKAVKKERKVAAKNRRKAIKSLVRSVNNRINKIRGKKQKGMFALRVTSRIATGPGGLLQGLGEGILALKEKACVNYVLKAGSKEKGRTYTNTICVSGGIVMGGSIEAGCAISGDGKMAPIVTISGTTGLGKGGVGRGAVFGLSAVNTTSFYNTKDLKQLKGPSNSARGGGSINGIYGSVGKIDGINKKTNKVSYSGKSFSIGLGPKWDFGLSRGYTFVPGEPKPVYKVQRRGNGETW